MKLSDAPADASIINSTMVLRKKPGKYKARLCACGNELKGQIADIYSPAIGALTYSIAHQIAIIDRMHVRIIDTTRPILLLCRRSMYIKMPVKVMEACKIPSDVVYRIEKYIYGLPDSGRAYYLAYSTLLVNSVHIKSKSDQCLFLKFYPDSGFVWMILLLLLRVLGYLTSSRLLSNLNSRLQCRFIPWNSF